MIFNSFVKVNEQTKVDFFSTLKTLHMKFMHVTPEQGNQEMTLYLLIL